MQVVKSAQEILNYLRADLMTSSENSELIDQIEDLKSNLVPPNPDQWKMLSARRTLSSNSLEQGETLKQWEAANHWMGGQIHNHVDLCFERVKDLNAIVNQSQGHIRRTPMFTGDMEYLPPGNLMEALADFEDRLMAPGHPLRKAFEVYLSVVTIHPFDNGNGRTARLAGDWILIENGFLPMCFDSSIQSHVAVTINHPLRSKEKSFQKFLVAIKTSYEILKS